MSRLIRAVTVAVAAVLISAFAAQAAHAVTTPRATAPSVVSPGTSGSIVYVKGNNLFIARGDGTHARALTTNGTKDQPYHSPSESDAGVIAAAHGTLIVRMDQKGKVLSQIDPPMLRNSAGEAMDGPVNDVALSPNGKTIAWSYVRYSCPVGVECMTRYATGYTAADHLTHAGQSTYFRAPSWVSSTRTLQTGGYRSQVMLQDIATSAKHWFDDSDYAFPSTDLADGELSPNGQWLAEVRGYNATSSIIWYRVSGNAKTGTPPAVPAYTCYTGGEAEHASPTWSPDSTALAWAGKTGIWIKIAAGNCASPATKLLIPGGSAPDWSPAPLT